MGHNHRQRWSIIQQPRMKTLKAILLIALLATSGCCTRNTYVGDGLMLKSPNGTLYQITVDDNGQPGTTTLKK